MKTYLFRSKENYTPIVSMRAKSEDEARNKLSSLMKSIKPESWILVGIE